MEDLFSDAVRQLLSDRCTPDVVRAIEAEGSCTGLWGHLEDAGYADALVPESAGGAGMGLGDLYAALELCGEFALPVPLGETLLARGVLSSAGVTAPRGTMSFGNGHLTLERLICGAVQGAKVSEWILVNCSGDYRVLPSASAELQASGFCLNAHLEWPLDIWEAASKVRGAWDLQAARSSCMTTFLKTARDGAILILTMSQPETRNALTGNTAADEFVQACETIRRDLPVRVVILTTEGPVFSSSGNVKDMQRYEALKPMPDVIREEYGNGIQRIPGALYNLDVPVIAAINGPAIGAGLDLTCMCDIRIASEKATFAESFVKVGIVPGDGGAWLLPRAVGMSKASEMAFTGEGSAGCRTGAGVWPGVARCAARCPARGGHVPGKKDIRQSGWCAADDQAPAARTRAQFARIAAGIVGRVPGDRPHGARPPRGSTCLCGEASAEILRLNAVEGQGGRQLFNGVSSINRQHLC